MLLQTVRERPNDATAHQDWGAYLVVAGKPFEGLWELLAAREFGRDDVALAVQIGSALQAGGVPEAAMQHLATARRRFVGKAGVPLTLARASLAAARSDTVQGLLRAATSPEGWSIQAIGLAAEGRTEEARSIASRCRAGTRNRPDLRLALGRLSLALGAVKQARVDLDAAAAARPDDEEALYHAGLAYASGATTAEEAKAVEYFQAAIRAAPRRARAGFAMGRLLYEKRGRWEKAREIYLQAAKLDPGLVEAEAGLARVTAALKLPEAPYHEARVREMTQRPDAAIDLYRRWGKRQPERWDSVLRAAECWMDMRRNQEAARELLEGLRRFPDHPELYNHLSQVHLILKTPGEAERIVERWAPRDATSGRPERVRARVALAGNDVAGALRWLDAAIAKDPAVAAFYADRAEALALDPTPEHLAAARAAMERAIAIEPWNAAYAYQFGTLLQQAGDHDAARAQFLRTLTLDSSRIEPYPALVAIARRQQRAATAALFAQLERAVRDQQRAEMAAWEAVWRHPADTDARFRLAMVLCRRGALVPARDHLAAAVELAPGRPEYRTALRRLRLLTDVL